MSEWSDRQVKDLGEIVTGRTPSTKRKDFYGGEYNLISPADLDNGKYIRTAHKRLTKLGFEQFRALPKDTVLVGCIGNVGKLGMVGNDQSATNQQINALICNAESDPEFVYYCFHENRDKLEKRAVKTTVPILNKTNFGSFVLSVPPLPEQKKIAHILSTVQRAMEAQERIIQTTTELKKALMHKLFTEGLRNEPQKQTEIGPVPESWEVVQIKATGTVVTGTTPSTKNAEFYGGDYDLISPADLDNGKYVRSAHKTLTKAGFEKCRTVPCDSVLVGCIGNVGKLGMVADDCSTTNQQINSIIPNSEFSPHFLYYALQLCRPRLEHASAKVTLPILNKSNFESFQIAAPKRKAQEGITGYLGILDQKLENAGQKTAQLQDLFRTLLHELMTAKTRVDQTDIQQS